MTAGRFRTLREIGREFGLPERRLAADAARFAAFIPCLEEGGRSRYGPAAAAALGLVTRLRAADVEDAAIAAELARGPVAFAPTALAVPVGSLDLASALNRRRERRRRALAALRDALAALGDAAERHRAGVAALREALSVRGTTEGARPGPR